MSDAQAKQPKSKGKPGDKGKDKPGDKDKDKDKRKRKRKGSGSDDGIFSVSANPRAGASIRRAKGWGGLAGFMIAALLSLRASVPIAEVGERALIAGAAGYLLAWACAVTIWRQLMIAQLRQAALEARQRHAETAAAQPTIAPRQ